MIAISIDSDRVEARLRAVAAELGNGGAASRNGADNVVALIRTHLAGLAGSRHATAKKLEASPTGHIRAQACRLERADARGATISIGIPGIGRAFQDIEIVPRRASVLTIPVHRLSYGRTVYEVSRDRPVFRPKGKNYLATTEKDGQLTVLYRLRSRVRQPRDPSLLPTREEIASNYAQGWSDAVRRALGRPA